MAKNILVVDDEVLVTKSVSRLLKGEGYDVAVAHSGSEALERIKATDFDLVISDIRMPEMDGIETIQRIRDYRTSVGKKKIPEILITGYADKEKYEAAITLKVADYIYKPFDREYILRIVKRALG